MDTLVMIFILTWIDKIYNLLQDEIVVQFLCGNMNTDHLDHSL